MHPICTQRQKGIALNCATLLYCWCVRLDLTPDRQSNSIAVAETDCVFSYVSEQSYVIAVIKENCPGAL